MEKQKTMILGILVATFIVLIICLAILYLYTLGYEEEEEHEELTPPSSPMNVL